MITKKRVPSPTSSTHCMNGGILPASGYRLSEVLVASLAFFSWNLFGLESPASAGEIESIWPFPSLTSPSSLATDSAGNLYIGGGGRGGRVMLKVDPAGNITTIFDSNGDGSGIVSAGVDIATDSSGNVYTPGSDLPAPTSGFPSLDKIFKIEPDGSITDVVSAAPGLSLIGAHRIANDPAGNLYVSGSQSDKVVKIALDGTITEIIDATGDGLGNVLDNPLDLAIDAAGNVYVAGSVSDNVFQIAPDGTIAEIIDDTGDGAGNSLNAPSSIATSASGNVYVAGDGGDSVFKIEPDGTTSEIIDASGDGSAGLSGARQVVVDSSENVYVAGRFSHNAFKVEPDGTITEIIDASGDGAGGNLDSPSAIATDAAGNVYLAGSASNNVFRIEMDGTTTVIVDATAGDPSGNALGDPRRITADGVGNLYFVGTATDNAFKLEADGTVTEIIAASGDGLGNNLSFPVGIATDAAGNVYVAGDQSDNVFKVEPDGTIEEILDASGDGAGNSLDSPSGIAVDVSGNVYVTGRQGQRNVFQIEPGGTVSVIIDSSGDGLGNSLNSPLAVATDVAGSVYVADTGKVFKRTSDGTVSVILDSTIAGVTFSNPQGIATDAAGNVYVTDMPRNRIHKIEPDGSVSVILDAGEGAGVSIDQPIGIVVDDAGTVYAAGRRSSNVLRIEPDGTTTEIADIAGDGSGNALLSCQGIAVDAGRNVYVPGAVSNNLFKISPDPFDHYVEYKVRSVSLAGDRERFPKRWAMTFDDVNLDNTDIDDPENYEIVKASTLLMPAMKNDELGPVDPPLHYVRYKSKKARQGVGAAGANGKFPRAATHLPRRWELQNQFGEITLDSTKTTSVLVPSGLGDGGAATPPTLVRSHFECYRVKAAKNVDTEQAPNGKFSKQLQAFFGDQFGDCSADGSFVGSTVAGKCLFDLTKPTELCSPAHKDAVEAPRESEAVIESSTAFPAGSDALLCYRVKLAKKLTSPTAAAIVAGTVGDKLVPSQSKHVRMSGIAVAPGNLFPVPTGVETIKTEAVCVPSELIAVRGVP